MKASIFMVTVMFSFYAKGQQNIFKNKPWEDFRNKQLLSQKLKQMTSAANNYNFPKLPVVVENKSVLMIPLTGTFIKNTGKGTDLYVINSYKMPCLVPDKNFTSNMPVAGYDNSQINSLLLKKESGENDQAR